VAGWVRSSRGFQTSDGMNGRRQGAGCFPELAVIQRVDGMSFQSFQLDMMAWAHRGPLERVVPSPKLTCLIKVGCRELRVVEEVRIAVRLPAAIGLSYGLRRFGRGPVKCVGWAC
jgi:hypothetical protein